MKIIPGEGIEKIKLGMSVAEVINILGTPDKDTDKEYVNYRKKGISFLLCFNKVRTIFLFSGRKGGYEKGNYKCFPGVTNEKIGLKSSYEDVLKEYNSPTKCSENIYEPIPSKSLSYDGIIFNFIKKNGKMISIIIIDKKQGTYKNLLSMNLKYHKDQKIKCIQERLKELQKIIKEAIEKKDHDEVKHIKELGNKGIICFDKKTIEKYEKKYFNIPTPYKSFIQTVGAFQLDHELVLKEPMQLSQSLGELIEEEIPDNNLDNLKLGHYHDFIILAEYGHFPSENRDYSYGLAFNKNNPNEIIEYANDAIWIASTPEERKGSCDCEFYEFLKDKLDRLIERTKEDIEELEEY